ncbi:L,D-transpeptidase family protein [Neoroseomonas soli]|uniref:L,D-transpeptidase family protein n=1 Tax=Neoroseomonas soli TaxID=1081025 RepID=A0A9X9WWZ9_9PROT|nr:L,D-transpeptidase family protein [Neoroseomonas soli]MBR0671678.1 L,D-transpeptidase family protein [Neoroseomonas soli]
MTGIARVTPDGLLRFRGETLRCALGAGGIRADKREGDGATPTGLLPIRRILWRADRGPRPACTLPAEPIASEDGWCDDPGHPDYNRPIRLPHAARHERLWRDDAIYDVIAVLGWNDAPVQRGRGSAIFLHVARPGLAPTEGCVALPENDLRRLLAAGLGGLEIVG